MRVLPLVALFVLAPTVGSDPHNYVQGGVGDVHLLCDSSLHPGIGGVCIPGGHILPDSQDEATLSIADASIAPTAGFYCQDLNEDTICGTSPDPSGQFCANVLLVDGVNWVSSVALVIRVSGPIFGAPVLNPCGLLNASVGTYGIVIHS